MSFRYGFVGGLHRSGTSLVARWLGSHPEVATFRETGVWEDEGQHLQDALPAARLLGGPGSFARHPGAIGEVVAPDAAQRLRSRLLSTWSPLWGDRHPVRVGKSPPNLLRGPLLQQVFPGAALIVVRRHPLAVALATRRMARRFRSLDVADLVEHWLIAHERLAAQLDRVQPFVGLELATLVAAPESIEPAFEALGLRPVGPPEPLEDRDAPYRQEWARLRASREGRRRVVPRVLDLAPRVARFGYRLDDFEAGSTPSTPTFSPR